ncbi:MAG: peptidylprolyl isomerase [Anaerolineae bacterium]|nr:peptidylprolyl isomerase [Anaerolineae bacterium]
MNKLTKPILTSLIALALFAACNNTAAPTPTQETLVDNFSPVSGSSSPCVGIAEPTTVVNASGAKQFAKPEQVIDPTHTYCAILRTGDGRIVIQLYPEVAPANVNSFVFLANQGYFDGLTFHRVLPGFMAQGGDPLGDGTGGPGYALPLEVVPSVKFDREGVVAMARSQAPDSAGSQFFITFAPQPALDPHSQQLPDNLGYTIIGQVVEGMNTVRGIKLRDPQQNPPFIGDPIVSIRIVDLGAK